MTQWLTLAVLAEDPSASLSTHIGWFTAACHPVPGDMIPFSGV